MKEPPPRRWPAAARPPRCRRRQRRQRRQRRRRRRSGRPEPRRALPCAPGGGRSGSVRRPLRTWATVATAADRVALLMTVDQVEGRTRSPPGPRQGPGPGSPRKSARHGIFETSGWIGHNGSIPGYESVTVYLPSQKATLVLLLNSDVPYQGQEPSTLLARAITGIVTPNNVYDRPVPPR
ncbi:serine hydrolase [Streptomyces sp. NPDC020681]|uniref:serine hydrolase n=1 Tax=Streptomyces sp. NPDC020681 TaxID=3365083 RepID=UPI0037BA79E8